MRIYVPLASIAVFCLMASYAEARKWTDASGNTVNADFVRVHEGDVILRQGGRLIRCPYEKFSEEDKAYIREQMARVERKKSGQPVVQPASPPGQAASSGGRELRTWQDVQGRKILAQYAGFSAGNIELLKDGARVAYPFVNFSATDQAYVREILVAEGRGNELPKVQAEEGGGMPQAPAGPPGFMPNFTPNFTPGAAVPNEPAGGSSPEAEQHSEPEPSPPAYQPPEPPSVPAANVSSSGQEEKPAGRGPQASLRPDMPAESDQTEEVWVGECSNCKKELPPNIGAGDRCPYCKVYFEYEEKPDGTYRNASGNKVSSWAVRGGGFGGLIFIVLVVLRLAFGVMRNR